MLSLHCALASCGAVYCNRSCLWVCVCVCLFVGLLPRLLEIACIDLHQTGFVGKGSDHLQLIKFWPSHAPRKGRDENFWLRLTTASAQCLRLSECFFILHCVWCNLLTVLSIFVTFITFRFYYYLIVYISSYITVYDMYVLPFGVIKNNKRPYGNPNPGLDYRQNLTVSSMAHVPPFHLTSWNKPANKETKWKRNIVGGGKNLLTTKWPIVDVMLKRQTSLV